MASTDQAPYRSGIYPRNLGLDIYPTQVLESVVGLVSSSNGLMSSKTTTPSTKKRPKLETNKQSRKGRGKALSLVKVEGEVYDPPLAFPSMTACLRHFKVVPAKGSVSKVSALFPEWVEEFDVEYFFD